MPDTPSNKKEIFISVTEPQQVSSVTRPLPGKNRSIALILGLMLACGAAEITGRFLEEMGRISKVTGDFFSLLALALLASTVIYIFRLVRHFPLVRFLITVGCALLFVGLLSSFVEEIPAVQSIPLLGKTQLHHVQAEHLVRILGAFFLVAGLYAALIEGEFAQRLLHQDHERLNKMIAEGEKSAQALQRNQDYLERVVDSRTTELAEKNDQLQVELAERRRTEALLAMRLRYEESLASCSQILLAGTEPDEALNSALNQLLQASRVCRVFICENHHAHNKGLVAEYVYEVWDPEKCPAYHTQLNQEFSYEKGLERWRDCLAKGEALIALRRLLPENEQALLKSFGVESLLLLPIGWEGHWRGFLGFEDRKSPREWTPEEVRMLRTAAEMVGACRERQRAEEILRSAYGDLELRVAERTSELEKSNRHLQIEMANRRRAEEEKAALESQLVQAHKMQAIGTLAGGIAHDFNNILSAILGHSELALRKMPQDDPSRRHFLEVLKSGNRAKELVRQILIFSRQAEQDWSPIHIPEIAREALEIAGAQLSEKIHVESDIDETVGAVLSDPTQLHQVMLNLCSNAIHAMEDTGGVLSLKVEAEQLQETLSTAHGDLSVGDYVCISVSDTGCGMDANMQSRIFEPFYTTKEVGKGTGMGLAILHGIVLAHHGAVSVSSSPGKGSTFRVYLPRYQGTSAQNDATLTESLFGNETILVVDDEVQLVGLWKESLEQFGYQVTALSDSVEALAHFEEDPQRYDLVLVDQTMPVLTGAVLAQRLLALRKELPIVMASGFSEAMSPKKAEEIGIRDFVHKPILANDICSAIRKALDRKSEKA